jgi:hypothetical protein
MNSSISYQRAAGHSGLREGVAMAGLSQKRYSSALLLSAAQRDEACALRVQANDHPEIEP